MKYRILAILPVFFFLCACSSETTSTTTTANSDSAMVASDANIAPGQIVTATTIPKGDTVSSVAADNVILSIPALQSGTVSAKFQNTFAMQLTDTPANLIKYGQSIGGMLQTIQPQLAAAQGDLATITSLVKNAALLFGYSPVTPGQHSVFSNIISIATKVSTLGSGNLETAIAGIQTTGAVPTTPTTTP